MNLNRIVAVLRLEWFRIRHPIIHWRSMKAVREVVEEIKKSNPSLNVLERASSPFKNLTRDEYQTIVSHASQEQLERIMGPYRRS
jgi:hypothetical protein